MASPWTSWGCKGQRQDIAGLQFIYFQGETVGGLADTWFLTVFPDISGNNPPLWAVILSLVEKGR